MALRRRLILGNILAFVGTAGALLAWFGLRFVDAGSETSIAWGGLVVSTVLAVTGTVVVLTALFNARRGLG